MKMKVVNIYYVQPVELIIEYNVDYFCNYGIKKPCSSRVYGFSDEGEYSISTTEGAVITSKFCKGECEKGKYKKMK